MAFMTPIMKPGWNLYNVHPPVKIKRKRTSKPVVHAEKGSEGRGRLATTMPLIRRRVSLNAGGLYDALKNVDENWKRESKGRLRCPPKACHLNPTRQGHYKLTSLSTDSLRMRDLDAAMSVIPEDDESEEHPVSSDTDGDTDPDFSLNPTSSSNPEISLIAQTPPTKRQRFLSRLRKLFGLGFPPTSAVATTFPFSKNNRKENSINICSHVGRKPDLIYRRRS